MTTNNKLTLTIGISALNEAANIQNLLRNLLIQNQTNFELAEIIVVSDGSTDATVQKASELNNPKIKIVDNKTRGGKLTRVNDIIDMAQSDIIAIIDADTLPTSADTFNYLLEPFVQDPETVYVSGELVAVKPSTFIEKAVLVSRSVWDKIRITLKNGKSIYTVHGALYAFKKDFAKANKFPKEIWADIGFHYFLCLKNNLQYSPAPKASVNFKLPATIKDYANQIERYQREDTALINYFGKQIENEYSIPKSMLYRYKAEAFVKYPIHCLVILAINFYTQHFKAKNTQNSQKAWKEISSTKKAILQ